MYFFVILFYNDVVSRYRTVMDLNIRNGPQGAREKFVEKKVDRSLDDFQINI